MRRRGGSLWTRGVGRNGKDTLCNIMQAVLGSYAVSMAAQTLSRIRDPSAPSPAYALCRARRFVAIREIDKCEPIRQQLYKVFTDPKSELTGRDVYEKIQAPVPPIPRIERPPSPCQRSGQQGTDQRCGACVGVPRPSRGSEPRTVEGH